MGPIVSATFGDFAGLTYVQAMVLEMMRWRPTTSYGEGPVLTERVLTGDENRK